MEKARIIFVYKDEEISVVNTPFIPRTGEFVKIKENDFIIDSIIYKYQHCIATMKDNLEVRVLLKKGLFGISCYI